MIDLGAFLKTLVEVCYDSSAYAEPLNQMENWSTGEKTDQAMQVAFAFVEPLAENSPGF